MHWFLNVFVSDWFLDVFGYDANLINLGALLCGFWTIRCFQKDHSIECY